MIGGDHVARAPRSAETRVLSSLLVARLSLCSVEYHAAEPALCITLMKSRQSMFRVGKAPCAFGLGRNMGGSLPAAQPIAIVARRRGVQAGSLFLVGEGLSLVLVIEQPPWGEYLGMFAQVSVKESSA
jgi:hypothetical protein